MTSSISTLRLLSSYVLVSERPDPRKLLQIASLLDLASIEIPSEQGSDRAFDMAHAIRLDAIERHFDNSEELARRVVREAVSFSLDKIADEWEQAVSPLISHPL